MGNTESRFGYHVLRVKPESPALKAGLCSYFDYILAVNDEPISESNQSLLANVAKSSLDRPVDLSVYNSRDDKTRLVKIVPSVTWGDESGGILGCSVRFIECTQANEKAWQITAVKKGSSVETAGLAAQFDFIICSLDRVLTSSEDFGFLVEKNPETVLKFAVYNSQTDSCREVQVEVGRDEFGKGKLDWVVSFGPVPPRQLPKAPGAAAASAAEPVPGSARRCSFEREAGMQENDIDNVVFSPVEPVTAVQVIQSVVGESQPPPVQPIYSQELGFSASEQEIVNKEQLPIVPADLSSSVVEKLTLEPGQDAKGGASVIGDSGQNDPSQPTELPRPDRATDEPVQCSDVVSTGRSARGANSALVVESSAPVVESSLPVAEYSPPVAEYSPPVVESSAPVVEYSPPAVESNDFDIFSQVDTSKSDIFSSASQPTEPESSKKEKAKEITDLFQSSQDIVFQ